MHSHTHMHSCFLIFYFIHFGSHGCLWNVCGSLNDHINALQMLWQTCVRLIVLQFTQEIRQTCLFFAILEV
ncbi:hypothetical protein L873DRAFT_696879 [Choiromyces venosus 120613-1]|uniref:Uncharacterized protein n=1 Tax=Choiromyces venosus 120613-1 TaxID=1336337 RepID=A0A3N4JSR2_9PEZI|nr:hypothetical protein L873DRAFT_696879 [Choiromyces venosus 120613-1]